MDETTFHKKQMLGRNSEYRLKLNIPRMKSSFIPRYIPPPADPRDTSTMKSESKKQSNLSKEQLRTVSDPRGTTSDNRGTNTLTYSQTLGKGTSDLTGTVEFRLTLKPKNGADERDDKDASSIIEEDNEMASMVKSNVGPVSPGKGQGGIEMNTFKSELMETRRQDSRESNEQKSERSGTEAVWETPLTLDRVFWRGVADLDEELYEWELRYWSVESVP